MKGNSATNGQLGQRLTERIPEMECLFASLETVYFEQRQCVVVQNGGFISTPLHVLKQLSNDHQEKLHTEVQVLLVNKDRLYRVEIFVGQFRGVGEGLNKSTASQMAALDTLLRMKSLEDDKACEIPPYALIPGWRLSPTVSLELTEFCQVNGLHPPQYETKVDFIDGVEVVTVGIHIQGRKIAVATNDILQYANKLAAAEAIDTLTGKHGDRTEHVAFGQYCMSHAELQSVGCNIVVSEFKKEWLKKCLDGEFSSHPEKIGADLGELAVFYEDLRGPLEPCKGTLPRGLGIIVNANGGRVVKLGTN